MKHGTTLIWAFIFNKAKKKMYSSAMYLAKIMIYALFVAVLFLAFLFLRVFGIIHSSELFTATEKAVIGLSLDDIIAELGISQMPSSLSEPVTVTLLETLPSLGVQLPLTNVSATSSLNADNGISYGAECLTDGNLSTSWQDGADDFGLNESISFSFTTNSDSVYILFYNGNQLGEDYYYRNNRAHNIQLIVNNKKYDIDFKDTFGAQAVQIDGLDNSETNITIVIKSVYAGTDYDDTCISEIEVYQLPTT